MDFSGTGGGRGHDPDASGRTLIPARPRRTFFVMCGGMMPTGSGVDENPGRTRWDVEGTLGYANKSVNSRLK